MVSNTFLPFVHNSLLHSDFSCKSFKLLTLHMEVKTVQISDA